MSAPTSPAVEPAKPASLEDDEQFVRAHDSLARASVRSRVFTGVVLTAIAVGLGFGLWILSRQLAPQITAPISSESAYVASFPEKSVAVLPFADLSKGKPNTLLAEAIQDDILTALAKISDLRVISRTSVSSYAPEQSRNLRAIAQSLGAGHLLEGNVRRTNDKVTITVQLTDARLGEKLWSTSWERKVNSVSSQQSALVMRIASQLQANISPKEKLSLDERPTQDLIAYGSYVRGKALLASVSNAQINEKLAQAAEALDEAIARDPQFYLAWCQLAAAHDYIYFFGFDRTPARLALAQKALDTVIRLRPEAGETHLAKANFLYRCYLDYDKARAELARSPQLIPAPANRGELPGIPAIWRDGGRA